MQWDRAREWDSFRSSCLYSCVNGSGGWYIRRDADVAQFSTLATNPQMYASKYLTYMPTKEQLRKEIEMQKEIFEIGKDM